MVQEGPLVSRTVKRMIQEGPLVSRTVKRMIQEGPLVSSTVSGTNEGFKKGILLLLLSDTRESKTGLKEGLPLSVTAQNAEHREAQDLTARQSVGQMSTGHEDAGLNRDRWPKDADIQFR